MHACRQHLLDQYLYILYQYVYLSKRIVKRENTVTIILHLSFKFIANKNYPHTQNVFLQTNGCNYQSKISTFIQKNKTKFLCKSSRYFKSQHERIMMSSRKIIFYVCCTKIIKIIFRNIFSHLTRHYVLCHFVILHSKYFQIWPYFPIPLPTTELQQVFFFL